MLARTRVFHLYINDRDAYEVVATGWSLRAAVLSAYWANANGLLGRWLALQIPGGVLFFLFAFSSIPLGSAVAFAYLAFANLVYFPLKAFEWRGAVLRARGYTLRSSIVATSSNDALKSYALSLKEESDHVPDA